MAMVAREENGKWKRKMEQTHAWTGQAGVPGQEDAQQALVAGVAFTDDGQRGSVLPSPATLITSTSV